ncbi:MAG: ABC transporter substrate-binding protein [Chloroflexi bacterium]|nr:ABC transporter substrate-binding protein [Chloroflexota bacterium]
MKVNHLKTVLFVFIVLLLLAGELSIPSQAKAEESYPLGVALGLSGTGAPYCKEAVEGLELAVNDINSQGGLLGRYPIKLFIRDTQTRPKVSEKVVKGLIQKNRVKAVIGTYSSACALAIKPILRNHRVLHIAPISNSENITKIDFSPYTYSVVPNTYMMSKTVVMGIANLAKEKGWAKYVTIASNYAWGRSSQEIQVDLFRKVAPKITLKAAYWPRLGQTRFNSFIVDIMARKPDFVLASIAGSDNIYWMRDGRDYRLFKSVANPGGLVSLHELINQANSIRRGLYGRCRAPFFGHIGNLRMDEFVKSYRAKFDRYPSDWAVLLYDAVHILRQGIEKANNTHIENVKDAMRGMTVKTTRGELYFRKIDNQLSCSAYFGRMSDDPGYIFPIYHDLQEFKGPDIWRSEEEIKAARR